MNKDIAKPKISTCFSDEVLADYISCVSKNGEADEYVAQHVGECDDCFSKIAAAISGLSEFDENADTSDSVTAIKKAKSIPRASRRSRGMRSFFKRNRYLIVSAIFFILSFVVKVYFLQFLVAAVVFGLKWIMDTGGTKALIMIYDAWQSKKSQSRF